MTIVICEAHEGADFSLVCREGKIADSLDLGRISTDACLIDKMSEEFDFMIGKGALLWLEEQAILSHPVEDFLEDLEMFFKGRGEYANVININEANFSNEVVEDILHNSLERSRGIAETKGHFEIFPLSERCDKSRSLDCFRSEPELVESGEHIHDREEHGEGSHEGEYVIDVGHGISILDD